ncbi:MAG: choice-of-anchor L domain-containing protein [Azoarcus sp.]|jgi:hypothetical protein|nr:choice-of-anchor L domain-containing protein [Azoarcus sp.]
MKKKPLIALALASIAMAATTLAHALEINVTNNPHVLAAALLGNNSDIRIVPGSVKFIGTARQSATYTGFNLVPLPDRHPSYVLVSPTKSQTIINPDGILLTTGSAKVNYFNTIVNYSAIPRPRTGSNALLEKLIGQKTYDQNVLTFQFTTASPSIDSVSADFVFASEEYPVFTGGYPLYSSHIYDVFGFFVDGLNYAFYPDGTLVSASRRNSFIDNSSNARRGNSYHIEYNGLNVSQHVIGKLDPTLSVHTLTVVIADTYDDDWDSGVFIGNLQGISGGGDGGINDGN